MIASYKYFYNAVNSDGVTNTLYTMIIKGHDGESHNVTSQGQGNYNTVGASAGIASFLGLNAGNLLGGFGGYGYNRNAPLEVVTSDDRPVSRYEAQMMDKLAAKDSENALLRSQIYTDGKIVDTTTYLMSKINEVSAEVRANKDAQCEVNREQAVYNGVNTATLSCIKGQIAELQSLSELIVPQRKVCNTCCGCE